ncbi:16S rRNA pseudouridine(516) synthase RsuA [Photobacterium phosphoreum]|jgi:16S rRNA pseudouridine516 synthase|uniref:Ribosomal small subunit pseudouridine synthase A n=1 Tax=Photobacterium phosphoreum TaxID=659 RepID=A0AAW4ZT74_PHOPO|nr:16S rRNA pseudouridine(516) synthase RsuA [Photobacterium phosphoreum]KJF86830.1 16S rRNA pseudouridylate synthase [Photobacterium phosphoreum]MCD9462720.1 16S rRNA pseudouridine(516) synthase RsuA [Photobacterium phosphoreum]MCD9471131.1 16S rRNA pseudouridine(516) synthase RsuA [Photobacterium phosphoreum]MCD9478873.1 16S rRNA pseudouridine(516) synthase RsuA [Photobacterium phosphoreum]MCD9489932.1 16S rRNA pseudouridine(516) synthase RsuA [Photobacterium phosphoreum]
MRLDKFLGTTLGITRREAGKLLRDKMIEVDGEIVRSASFSVGDDNNVEFNGRPLRLQGPRYFMLNKPQGFVCSHVDDFNPTVFVLFDEVSPEKMHVAGRLDSDTTGLTLLTDDGQWSHRITSPRHVCEKVYFVETADPIVAENIAQFEAGVQLNGEEGLTRPAKLEIVGEREGVLTITEGKYHQVKRMFAAVGNRVVGLHRERVGTLELDEDLEPGQYRPLTAEEIASFLAK